jgi:hypothetical protein
VRLETEDEQGGTFEKQVTIEVVAANIAPSDIALSNQSVDENQPVATTVGNLTTTDPDGPDPPTYSLVAGPGSEDNAKFELAGATLRTAVALNFEAQSEYKVRIRTNDGRFAGDFEKQFPITAGDVNEVPTDIALSNAMIAENEADDVGTLSTTDPDTGQSHAYALVPGDGSDDNAQFTLAGNTLQTAGGLDFEAKSSSPSGSGRPTTGPRRSTARSGSRSPRLTPTTRRSP